jgi:glycosyltransferase involved in cell wall biosynthesis
MVKFLLPLYQEVAKSTHALYFIGDARNNDSKLKNVKTVSKYYFYLSKTIDFLSRSKIGKKVLANKRYYMEKCFDYFSAKKIQSAKCIVASCYLPKTFAKNSRLGGRNIFVAGNPCEFAIRKVLLNLELELDVKIDDVYTYRKRLDFIKESYKNVDELLLFTESQKNTYIRSYSNKKVYYREAFIRPNSSLFPKIEVSRNDDVFTFCYIAHSVWLKGLTVLLEAWKLFEPKGARLVIGGSIEPGLLATIQGKYGGLVGVEFLGRVENLNLFFREAHMCIVPSLLDAGPATVAEALSCGIPVVCSDGCGSSTLVNGKFGIVVEAGNAIELGDAMRYAMSNYNEFQFTSDEFYRIQEGYLEDTFYQAATQYILEGVAE